jgi:hypothetical protein
VPPVIRIEKEDIHLLCLEQRRETEEEQAKIQEPFLHNDRKFWQVEDGGARPLRKYPKL